jgi:hypothetical protein
MVTHRTSGSIFRCPIEWLSTCLVEQQETIEVNFSRMAGTVAVALLAFAPANINAQRDGQDGKQEERSRPQQREQRPPAKSSQEPQRQKQMQQDQRVYDSQRPQRERDAKQDRQIRDSEQPQRQMQAQRDQRVRDAEQPQRQKQAQQQRQIQNSQQAQGRQQRTTPSISQPERTEQQAQAWQRHRGWLQQGGGWQGRDTWQQSSSNWNNDHRSWEQRGGYGGAYVPQNSYNLYFGKQHYFRLRTQPSMFMGFPRFAYGGFSFMMVDPWPGDWASNWYDTDDLYIDYQAGYYLYNRRYPRSRIAIMIVM